MQKINDLMSETGLYEQKMEGYVDGIYTIQIFVACDKSWFYVLIYRYNDELIGVATFITEGTQTVYKLKYAKYRKIVEELMEKVIKLKEKEYEDWKH